MIQNRRYRQSYNQVSLWNKVCQLLSCCRQPCMCSVVAIMITGNWLAKAIFTLLRVNIAFAPAWKPYRIGHLFTHENCVLGAVSVTAQSCAATISKVLCHSIYWRGFVPYFAAAWTSITTVAEVDKQERELESSAPNLLGQTRRRDVWCECTCAVSGSFPCRHENLSDTVWT